MEEDGKELSTHVDEAMPAKVDNGKSLFPDELATASEAVIRETIVPVLTKQRKELCFRKKYGDIFKTTWAVQQEFTPFDFVVECNDDHQIIVSFAKEEIIRYEDYGPYRVDNGWTNNLEDSPVTFHLQTEDLDVKCKLTYE